MEATKIKIELREWGHTCGDGCCYNYGTKLLLNGKELDNPDNELEDNSYIGDDVGVALEAVLKELGYNVEIERTYEE